jgi:hypothetical protein
MATLPDRLQASIDDVARCARRHANDRDSAVYDDVCALYRKLLAHKRKVDVSFAANRKETAST